MNYIEIIEKKEENEILDRDELSYIFNRYLNGFVNDNDMTKLLKAICKYGLTDEETFDLTDIFLNSGDKLCFDNIGTIVDKHSTGGVGDKITLIIGPIAASLGIKVAKMSGRGLGHTGGTIDKLESISGFNVNLDEDQFLNQIKNINIAISAQTANVVPLDKKVYALRDVTNTTMSIPLIASSIMSKKIACGANKVLIDVKVGNGALLRSIEEAEELSNLMIRIGKKYNREITCILTDMNIPLGNNVGNGLEVIEALEVLKGHGSQRLKELSVIMASYLVAMGKNISYEEAVALVNESINSLKAYNKFLELVKAQDGNICDIKINPNKIEIYSKQDGYIEEINALKVGILSGKLGAGRINKDDSIDYGSGIVLNKEVGDFVLSGELLCTIYTSNKFDINEVYDCFKFSKDKVTKKELIYKIIK